MAPENKTIEQHAHVNSPPPPHRPAIVVQLRKRERYVLISRFLQEKYIPEGSFHVCHITEENVSPPGTGRQPGLPTTQLRHMHVAAQVGNSLHSLHRWYICTCIAVHRLFSILFLGRQTSVLCSSVCLHAAPEAQDFLHSGLRPVGGGSSHDLALSKLRVDLPLWRG